MSVARDGTQIVSHPLACLRKRNYTNEARAWSVIFNMRARHQDTERLQPYRCDRCNCWHIGSLPATLVSHPPLSGAT